MPDPPDGELPESACGNLHLRLHHMKRDFAPEWLFLQGILVCWNTPNLSRTAHRIIVGRHTSRRKHPEASEEAALSLASPRTDYLDQ